MAAIAGNKFTLAIGKQAAKGGTAGTASFKLKLTGGDVEPARTVFQLAETDASRQQGASVVVGASVAGSPEFYVRPDDFPLIAYGLLGSNADSGVSPNYTHTATPADSGPYFTLWKNIGGGVLVDQYRDVRVTGARIRGQAGQPLTIAVDLVGLQATFGATDAAGNVVTQDPLVYPQVTVTKGGTAPGTVESFDISIMNNGATIQADGTIYPYDYVWGKLDASGTMTILFENDTDYRKFHTGTGTGTALTTTLFAEALTILAQVNANLSITFTMLEVAYTAYPVPPDPGGAPIRVALAWRSEPQAAIADYITITTKNQLATVP